MEYSQQVSSALWRLIRVLSGWAATCGLMQSAAAQVDVVAWGSMVFDSRTHRENFAEIASGYSHTVTRRGDGSVVAWGDNSHGECNVSALPPALTYVEIAAGRSYTIARRSDGSVLTWGDDSYGQHNVPALPAGLTYVEIAANLNHAVARRSDGSVVAWGENNYGQCNVPALPTGLTYVEIAAGPSTTVARRSDGSGSDPEQLAHAAFLTEQRRVS